MVKFPALVPIILLVSCASGPAPSDRLSVVVAVINDLYANVDQDVAAAAICESEKFDVSANVLQRVHVKTIPAVQCSKVDHSMTPGPFRLKGGSGYAVVLSVDKVTFESSRRAIATGAYSYAGLNGEGLVFTVEKSNDRWVVVSKTHSWYW